MMLSKRTALKFVILFGFVSLFADITYEGAKSISGQFLAILGASGTVVGFVSGFGEFVGYGFRLISGYLSDKTKRYWLMTFIGYTINLLAVPLLALAGDWPMAAVLLILERFGKAIRSPSKDAMLSFASARIGRGFGFGLHEAMDQIGAIMGPLIVSAVIYYRESYRESFLILLFPALCAISVLAVTYFLYPKPQNLEIKQQNFKNQSFSKTYWIYISAVSCIAAGYVDFPLIAYHFKKIELASDVWIPTFFAIAMAADGIAALIFGPLYDKKGMIVLIFSSALSALFAPLVFLGNVYLAFIGIIFWGIGLGAQESIMRAVVANLVQMDKRGTAYGILNTIFGTFWFLGSALMGYLYDVSLISLIIFSFSIQLASIPLLYLVSEK